MKFSTAAAATLLSATALAAPTATTDKETTTFQIKDFTTRKYDGKTISTMSFRILATTGGTLDFECVPYDPVTKGATENFESGHVYSCGENSFFSFSYTDGNDIDQTNELFLWQDISENNTIGGSAFLDEPICRAGGAGINDLVCQVPEQVYFAITLEKLGA
ncbi:putative major allergen alt protein [Botryosphaeria dothidea]|uniref:Major allergen alt protein n=1 Tax=Botryosphaeria dothidea TaxID=55169 RepID=A0A8H4IZ04_9PEZI|nr:putative major allergen alt protein [Botryosphaeria dothidea]